MRTTALILTVAGGVLPILGAWWGYRNAQARIRELTRRVELAKSLTLASTERSNSGLESLDVESILKAEGIPVSMYDYEHLVFSTVIERTIVKESLVQLKGPAVLAFAGVMLGTIGASIALYAA